MTALDRLMPTPALAEIDHVDVAAPAARVWDAVRHLDLAGSALVRALFALRTLPGRLHGERAALRLRLDDLVSSPDHPGFQILVDDPPREIVVGAIGKVWQLDIPFVHVNDAIAFAAFNEPDFAKVAWAIRVIPEAEESTRVELELCVDTTDQDALKKFRRYFRVIGPASRFMRHVLLAQLVRELGTPEQRENQRPFPSDALLPDAAEQITHAITIAAAPEIVWLWLVQMGCRRGGFYSIDLLDNAGVPSARELHPELLHLTVGEIIPATPDGDDGFEVLGIDEPRALALGGLFDPDAGRQLPFAAPRPTRYWHVTWVFALERLDGNRTRLHVRARAAFSPSQRLHAAWIRPVHHLMQTAQLRHLAARAEGRLPRESGRDLLEGTGGAAIMAVSLFTPFLRGAREHWGIYPSIARRTYPGDDLIPDPRWSWTHGIEVQAPADDVWPWIAQMGADRGGFYSYQWLENIAGCDLRNAERIHPEWEHHEGETLSLHPTMPAMRIAALERGRYLLAHGAPDPQAQAAGKPWASATWLFFIEPLGEASCRVISRFRAACSDDLATRLSFGPTFNEPVGFAMDRRMLMGIKARSERQMAHEEGLRTWHSLSR
jgi:hypothetical protein